MVQFKDPVNNRPRTERWQKAANDPHRFDYNASTGFTKYQEDKDGPWLDFTIAGHPKCGTTNESKRFLCRSNACIITIRVYSLGREISRNF
jgi:hypothetical protein